MASRKAARAAASAIDPALFPLVLYKRILRLHYGLPPPARSMGDAYVKDEWRRHKAVPRDQALVFLREWTEYCGLLAKQLSNRGIVKGHLGKDFAATDLDIFSEEQLSQLLELKEEAERDAQRARGEEPETPRRESPV